MRRFGRRMLGVGSALALSTAATAAQQHEEPRSAPAPTPDSQSTESADDIVVRGHRVLGSAIGTIEPVAVLDADALKAVGATTMRDLLQRLKGIATSAAGGEPAMLLNGRRVAGPEELYSLPFEAIDRTEILSEQDAARLGFPPTVRVMNFITKKQFHSLELQQDGGTTTEGGGTYLYSQAGATRIDDGRRASVTASYMHRGRVLQSDRAIVPDPDTPFALQGNVTGVGGGSIDPALDTLAGRPVTIAAVPLDAAARGRLSAYTGGAAVTDIGPYRTLVPALNQARIDATFARPIGSVSTSINLSAQQQRTMGLNGLAAAALTVPPGAGDRPFADPVVVDRYLPGTVLMQQGEATTLHGGVSAQGGAGRWSWVATGQYDHALNTTASDIGVPTAALQADVTAGGDPLQPLSTALTDQRIVQRSRSSTDTVAGHTVANGPLLRLPAGDAQMTLTTDYSRSSSVINSGSGGATSQGRLTRTVASANASVDLPVTSTSRGVLGFAGDLGVNASVGITRVSRYGRLANSSVGVHWAPARPIQLLASVTQTRTAPAINQLTDPLLTIPNVPVFDYLTGRSTPVTTLTGGNPALAPERRRISTASLAIKPFAKRELRLTLDLVDTRIDGQATSLADVTQPFQAAFPSLFTRDAAGALTAVDYRPINLARERERKFHWSIAGNTPIGHAPPPAPPAAPGKPAPPPPPPRLNLYVFLSGNYRFDDRLTLREGTPRLDLLDGASLTGTGGRPRWDVDGTIGANYGAFNVGIYNQIQGPTRIRSDVAGADLRFSGRTSLLLYGNVDLGTLAKRRWTKGLYFNLWIENLLNDRIEVRDRTGATPNRFQPAYLDPAGRDIRAGVRKLF